MKKSLFLAAASAFAAGTLVASVVSAQTPNSPSFGNSSTDCKGHQRLQGPERLQVLHQFLQGPERLQGPGLGSRA